MRSVDASSSRGSIPRARSRISRPDFPGASARSAPSSSSAIWPIVSIPGLRKPFLRARPDPWERPHRERGEEGRLPSRPDDREPARLAAVGRHLRDHLRGREADRAREPSPASHDGLHRLCQRAGVVEVGCHLAQVEVALVDPCLLDRWHDVADDRPHFVRVVAVEAHARRNEDGLRTAAQRLGARHRRADSEAPGCVVRRRHDAAPARIPAHDERPPGELGAFELLHGCEERVQIEVRDDQRHATRVVLAPVAYRSRGDRSERRGDGDEANGDLATHVGGRECSRAARGEPGGEEGGRGCHAGQGPRREAHRRHRGHRRPRRRAREAHRGSREDEAVHDPREVRRPAKARTATRPTRSKSA